MIKTLNEYLELVTDLQEKAGRGRPDRPSNLWYRGVKDDSLGISPGLYWRNLKSEWGLVADFLTTAPQYIDRVMLPIYQSEFEAPWEWYFLMRHYGMPTRLIDWTESPLAALYFALAECTNPNPPPSTPCVWVLNPASLNKKSINFGDIIAPAGKFSKHWLYKQSPDDRGRCQPGKPEKFTYAGKQYSNKYPMAINPVRSNPRILAQQGVFTVHGADRRSLDQILGVYTSTRKKIDGKVLQIQVDRMGAPTIRKALALLQIHKLALFPELSVFVEHLMEMYGIKP